MKPSSNLGCAIILLLILVILVVALLIIQSTGLADILHLPQPTPTNIVQPSVIDQIKPLGQLHTSSYFLSTVVETQMRIGLLNQLQRVLLVVCGKVDAGVDLSKIQQQDVQISGDTAIIHLPDPEIFTAQVFDDRKCTYVVLREEGFALPPNLNLETAAREAAVANFKETALANDILPQARKNAEGEIRRLLILVGYRDIQFTP